MESKNGKEKIISFYAKNARGAMARFIIQNKLQSEEDLKKFNLDGYIFNAEKSSVKVNSSLLGNNFDLSSKNKIFNN